MDKIQIEQRVGLLECYDVLEVLQYLYKRSQVQQLTCNSPWVWITASLIESETGITAIKLVDSLKGQTCIFTMQDDTFEYRENNIGSFHCN